MSTPTFSLVIPTYKERVNIAPLLRQLSTLLDGALPGRYELIVVDDDSPDRTWEAAEEIAAQMPQVRVIRRIGERGLATAVVAGWKAAQGVWLGVIDADLQHPPEVVLALLAAMERGADLAVASRHVAGGGVSDWSLFRRMLSRGAQALGILLLPSAARAVSDPMSGYFVLRRGAVDLSELHPLGYKILLEVLALGDFPKIEEAGYVFQERREGSSKVTWRLYGEYLLQIWRLRAASRRKLRK
ncbi:MAG: polyprenol monophosphomannose synthase [Chthoniobacteraceae bacterium]|nr:polyprenol monophosphomannose synthase [Chthoniobacteraceae bacterium]